MFYLERDFGVCWSFPGDLFACGPSNYKDEMVSPHLKGEVRF